MSFTTFIFIGLFFLLFIGCQDSKNEDKSSVKQNINKEELVEQVKNIEQPLLHNIEFVINDNLQTVRNNVIDYVLSQNNNRVYLEIKDKNLISFIELDGNLMNAKNKTSEIKIFFSTYEIIPSSHKLKIYYYDGSIDYYDINAKYVYTPNSLNNKYLEKSWIFSPTRNYFIRTNGIVLAGEYINNQPTTMQFSRDFDGDISMRIDFEPLKDKVTDLKFAFGERLSFSFNNKRIDIFRREIDPKTKKNKWVRYYFIEDFIRLKKGTKYSIYIKRFEGNKYNLEFVNHSNNSNNRKQIYIDDKKNNLEFERYKNLRILLGSKDMKITITRIEVF